MRAKYAIIGLALAMACYLFYLMQHLHDPGTTETRLQGLLRAQAAEIVRLKQLLRKSQQQQRSKAAAVPLDAVPQTPPDLAPIVAAGQPPADGGAYGPEENFLLATRSEVATAGAAGEPARVLRGLLGIAYLLNRTLILPPGSLSDALQSSQRQALAEVGVRVRSSTSLSLLVAATDTLKCSHVRLETPRGLDSEQFAHALRHYSTTRILEFDLPHESYCGVSPRATNTLITAERRLEAIIKGVVVTAGNGNGNGNNAPHGLGRCAHSLKEEEESMYWDIGKCKGHRVRVALPESVTRLPKGSDLMVTFSTGGVATMAHNWVAALEKAGVNEGVLIGALDGRMLEECEKRKLPCVKVAGDASTTKQLKECKSENIRACPQQYPKMSILKVGFYRYGSSTASNLLPPSPFPLPSLTHTSHSHRSLLSSTHPHRELLTLGFNVFACDADAIFMNDPRPLMKQTPWTHARWR